mmetsp:Transcript_25809/g.52969  ORF Transcript_25809/g.52969 Transcript_25809/m.52969 type:complete len:231 (-) Transcript_25809:244-936(-)
MESPPSSASKDDKESSMGEKVTDSIIGAESESTNASSPLWTPSSAELPSVNGTTLTLSPLRSLRSLARISERVHFDDEAFFFFCTKTLPYVADRLRPMTATTSPFDTPSSFAFFAESMTAASVIAEGCSVATNSTSKSPGRYRTSVSASSSSDLPSSSAPPRGKSSIIIRESDLCDEATSVIPNEVAVFLWKNAGDLASTPSSRMSPIRAAKRTTPTGVANGRNNMFIDV